MSEEVLKALVQLFAIIAKQGSGISTLEREYIERSFLHRLSEESVLEYMELFDSYLEENYDNERTSVLDSLTTLSICSKINETLTQKQKVFVLLELLELLRHNPHNFDNRKDIIDTVSSVFNVPEQEYLLMEKFALKKLGDELNYPEFLIANHTSPENLNRCKFLKTEFELEQPLIFVYIPSVELIFFKYESPGNLDLRLNHRLIRSKWLYLFSQGSIIKHPKGHNIYHSQVLSILASKDSIENIHFVAKDVSYKFPNNVSGLVGINIEEEKGSLIGILGGSGTGKTTLLNILSSLEKPTNGTVTLNGVDIHRNYKNINGAIGYVPQFDILIAELTVFENLQMTARLCMGKLSAAAIDEKVEDILKKLGLWHIKDYQVGSINDKKISGGQRKRLNIALELIREPMVIFLDEPTSGLSSKDSESIIQLLKEMTSFGKIIFSVVHQPSADIFKMFDKIILLDHGGYCIYYGNPLESLIYFKRLTNQINSNLGYCHVCGSINPEELFEIIEARIVNEYGVETEQRRHSPEFWYNKFNSSTNSKISFKPDETVVIPKALVLPSKLKQFALLMLRDTKQKIRDYQYLFISFFEAPALAFILSYILKYAGSINGEYSFMNNENIPAYMFLGIIISMFMGLTGSAEEILKDKILRKRERLLFLSRKSYLTSKIVIQFFLSGVQTFSFVLIGNYMLELHDFFLEMWLMLFSTSCLSNMLGLNISSMFRKAVTIYIVIPLLLIPQLILSGALFDFDKMNSAIRGDKKVPLIADIIASRWAYEGLMVHYFINNPYEEHYYDHNIMMSNTSFVNNYLVPELRKVINSPERGEQSALLRDGMNKLQKTFPDIEQPKDWYDTKSTSAYLNHIQEQSISVYNYYEKLSDQIKNSMGRDSLILLKNKYHNDRLEELVRNITTNERIKIEHQSFVRNIDPIYYWPKPGTILDYRAHFFAPKKYFMGHYFDTFYFNISIIWLMTLTLYIALYYNIFRRIIKLKTINLLR